MAANSSIRVTNINFNTIKSNLKSEWSVSDYNIKPDSILQCVLKLSKSNTNQIPASSLKNHLKGFDM